MRKGDSSSAGNPLGYLCRRARADRTPLALQQPPAVGRQGLGGALGAVEAWHGCPGKQPVVAIPHLSLTWVLS